MNQRDLTRTRSPYDQWYVDQSREGHKSTYALTGKHLELLERGEVVGAEDHFHYLAMENCVDSSVEIAARLVSLETARLELRFRAMLLLVSLSPYSLSIKRRIGNLSVLLQLEPSDDDPYPHLERMGLALGVIANEEAWRAHRDILIDAVRNTCRRFGLTVGDSTWSRRDAKRYAQRAKSYLLEAMSNPNPMRADLMEPREPAENLNTQEVARY